MARAVIAVRVLACFNGAGRQMPTGSLSSFAVSSVASASGITSGIASSSSSSSSSSSCSAWRDGLLERLLGPWREDPFSFGEGLFALPEMRSPKLTRSPADFRIARLRLRLSLLSSTSAVICPGLDQRRDGLRSFTAISLLVCPTFFGVRTKSFMICWRLQRANRADSHTRTQRDAQCPACACVLVCILNLQPISASARCE